MYHLNAYLPNIKFLKPGLKSRNKLLNFLKKEPRITRKNCRSNGTNVREHTLPS